LVGHRFFGKCLHFRKNSHRQNLPIDEFWNDIYRNSKYQTYNIFLKKTIDIIEDKIQDDGINISEKEIEAMREEWKKFMEDEDGNLLREEGIDEEEIQEIKNFRKKWNFRLNE